MFISLFIGKDYKLSFYPLKTIPKLKVYLLPSIPLVVSSNKFPNKLISSNKPFPHLINSLSILPVL
jgi:hypothetical protein